MRSIEDASFSELMMAACRRMNRSEVLIIADLEDDPASSKACVWIGQDMVYVERASIVAKGR